MDSELSVSAQIDLWRQKQLAGTLTDEDLKEAVKAIRADRIAASQQGAKSRALKPPPKTAEQMLDELENL